MVALFRLTRFLVKYKTYYILGMLCIVQSSYLFAWNALGHRLIAQVAYDSMTPQARQLFEKYNQAMDKVYKPRNLINAATWLDTLRYQGISWFSTMHYIDIPFTEDGTQLPPVQDINAVWAVEKAQEVLRNQKATDFDKGLALRVLLHVVGDLHQPLHAATRVSQQFPQGDKGGNLLTLGDNPIACNLHAYWDKGAGLLVAKQRYGKSDITKQAKILEQRWPCQLATATINPVDWASESHNIAVNQVYKLLPKNNTPNKTYQALARAIAMQRIAEAGCRLGALLNHLALATDAN